MNILKRSHYASHLASARVLIWLCKDTFNTLTRLSSGINILHSDRRGIWTATLQLSKKIILKKSIHLKLSHKLYPLLFSAQNMSPDHHEEFGTDSYRRGKVIQEAKQLQNTHGVGSFLCLAAWQKKDGWPRQKMRWENNWVFSPSITPVSGTNF